MLKLNKKRLCSETKNHLTLARRGKGARRRRSLPRRIEAVYRRFSANISGRGFIYKQLLTPMIFHYKRLNFEEAQWREEEEISSKDGDPEFLYHRIFTQINFFFLTINMDHYLYE